MTEQKAEIDDLSREEKIERITNALWRTSDDKLDVIAAVIDL